MSGIAPALSPAATAPVCEVLEGKWEAGGDLLIYVLQKMLAHFRKALSAWKNNSAQMTKNENMQICKYTD